MVISNNDIIRAAIIVALILIIYYFYQENKNVREENVNNTQNTSQSTEPFVKGMWEGDEGLYRAQARAFSWCPPSNCADKHVYAEDLISTNPFRWPDSGGNYYLSHTEDIKYRDGTPANLSNKNSAQKNSTQIDESDKQQQDHETFNN